MFRRKKLLPDVPIYMMMGGVGENFGGVTNVALHRSSIFSELDNRPIGFLTTSMMHAVDPGEREGELKASKRLGPNVHFKNAWFDLGTMSDEDLKSLTCGIDAPAETVGGLLPYAGAPEETRVDGAGTILQVDRFRTDGTRYLSDRKDMRVEGVLGGRLLTAFTRDGEVARQWEGARFVYHAWIDWLTDGETSIIIVDSANSANLMFEYRRDHVVMVHPIHSTHAFGRTTSGRAWLAKNQHRRFTNLDSFDLVTALTEHQTQDLKDDGIGSGNLVTLSNMTAARPVKKVHPRDPRRGVVLGRLSNEKRIDHMMRAVSTAASRPTLDVYGHGDAESGLAELINDFGLGDAVRLRGYDPGAREQFETASFTLLTSTHEGQPLVLVEAMASGCIPISYDINYGPSDIITHGVDGFLVPNGDIKQLTATIDEFAKMSEPERTKMRKAAVKRSQDFTPKQVARQWGRELEQALSAKRPAQEIGGNAKLTAVAANDGRLSITVAIDGAAARAEQVMVTWMQRNGLGYGRVFAAVENSEVGLRASASLRLDDIASVGSGTVDFWVDVSVDGNPSRFRVKGAGEGLPFHEGNVEVYATKHKSLSLIVENQDQVDDEDGKPTT